MGGEAFIAAVRRAGLRYGTGRRRWFPRRTEERRLRAIRDALAAYQPVRAEIEPIWDRSRATRLAADKREKAERAEQWARAEAAYEAWWGTRAAAAELAERKAWRLTGAGEITYGRGRSAYELALTLAERPRWTPQALAVLPDDPERWWAGVESAARNRQALDTAVHRCAATVHRVLRALVAAGRPGIEEFTTSTGHRKDGWPKYWTCTSVEDYLGITFDDSVTYHQSGWSESSISFRMADEADPAAFIPFVDATADVIVAGFEHLLGR